MTSDGRRPRRDPVKAHLCLLVVAGALSAALFLYFRAEKST